MDENPYKASQTESQRHKATPAPEKEPKSSWLKWQAWIALGLIPGGFALSFLGLVLGFSASTSGETNWLWPVAKCIHFGGPFVSGAAVVWLLVVLVLIAIRGRNTLLRYYRAAAERFVHRRPR